jgi:hypothetical protein
LCDFDPKLTNISFYIYIGQLSNSILNGGEITLFNGTQLTFFFPFRFIHPKWYIINEVWKIPSINIF